MGNFFSSRDKQQPVIVNDEEQFFDCLTDDETHIQTQPVVISHYYAVSIPSNVETTGRKIFDEISDWIGGFFRKSIRL